MQLLSDIVRDTDENFGLGNRAAVLVSEAAKCLFDTGHEGLKGFLERLESAGLAADLANWRNPSQEIRFPEGVWVDQVLGLEAISRIGRDLGMANARVRTALAYVIPHLIRYFAAGSTLPDQLPPAVDEFLGAGRPEHLAPRSRGIKKTPRKRRRSGRRAKGSGKFFWAGGVFALLISGYFLGQDVLTRGKTEPRPASVKASSENPAKESLTSVGRSTEPQQPQPAESRAPGSKLVIRNYGNQIEYLGFVNSQEMRAQLTEKLQIAFGAPRLMGEVVVESERAEPLWIGPLDRLLPLVNVPGLDIRLEGNTVRVGGWLAEEDRTSVLNNLMSTLGASYRFGYLREEEVERNQDSKQFILAALGHATPDIKPQDVVAILNHWVIGFAEGSAVFPDDANEILTRVSDVIKSTKPQFVIEIQGHVDAEGTPGSAQKLSLERANAVRDALIKTGVQSGVLRTKGYGADKRLATGGAPFDHLRNQRIEFRVIQVCDAYFPCASSTPPKRLNVPDPNLPVPDLGAPAGSEGEPPSAAAIPPVKPVLRPAETSSLKDPSASTAARGERGRLEADESRDEGQSSATGSKLKALSEELPPPPKPRPKPVPAPTKPPTAKPQEWYDPLGLF